MIHAPHLQWPPQKARFVAFSFVPTVNGDVIVVEGGEDRSTDVRRDVVLVCCVFVFNELDMEGDLETGGKTSNGFVGISRFLNEAQHDCSDKWSWL